MDNTNLNISRVQTKRRMWTSALLSIIAAISIINNSKHSNIRIVEILPILGCGLCIGVFIANFALLNLNKQRNSTETGN
ncbi:MAG: hypothetical protein ABIN89_29875 [Chitinophagaceae bacterium]